MAKAHFVKSARKDYPEQGIQKGESYYWWSFRRAAGKGYYSTKHYSKTRPKPSQLTQSAFYSTLYSIQEGIDWGASTADSLEGDVQNLIADIESLRDETQGSLDNMPEGLQESETGQLLQERIDALETWISELEGLDLVINDDELEIDETALEGLPEEERETKREELIEEKREEALADLVDELNAISCDI